MKRYALALALLAISACGNPEKAAPTSAAPAPKTQTPETPKAETAPQGVYAEMTTVDYEGKPVSGMIPIATRQPNAFDEPLAHGTPTDETGHSAFMLPQETHLFLRAWDPEMRMFANNFYEMPAMKGTTAAPTTITMVPAAGAEAVFHGANGQPLANTQIDIMLVHEKRGPWWPAHATTNATGSATFTPLPPGEYIIEFHATVAGTGQVPKTFLPPTRTTALGTIRLQ